MFFLLTTLLSALCVNLSFFYPDHFGLLIIIGLFLLAYLLMIKVLPQALLCATIWSVCVFPLHFIWLYALLINRSEASMMQALLLYGIIVMYFMGTFVAWFCGTRWVMKGLDPRIREDDVDKVMKGLKPTYAKASAGRQVQDEKSKSLRSSFVTSFLRLFTSSSRMRGSKPFIALLTSSSRMRGSKPFSIILSLLSMLLYHLFISHISLTLITGYKEGYPFLNPCIPLAKLITKEKIIPSSIHYLKPIKSYNHPIADGQKIFHALTKQNISNKKIIVAPESFFNFPMNRFPSLVALWSCIIPADTFFIFGSQWEEDNHLYQVACCLHKQKFTWVYRKKHLIAFVEQMPPLFSSTSWLRALFLHNVQEFKQAPIQNPIINVHDQKIMVQLCSEFFFTKVKTDTDNLTMIFFLVNDSWFVDYFRKIMENLACIKSVWLNTPVLYVGHNHCKLVSRKGLHECIHVKRR